MSYFSRFFPLEDIRIRSGGDGRTVEAYAAVFDTPTEIMDQDGHYLEEIARTAFDKTLAERGNRIGVFYNHGRTIWGTASDRASVPIGTPLEVRVDGRGLYTVTRYNKTPLAEEVLEAIREGAITGQSFSGRIIQSSPKVPRGGFRPNRDGTLPTVRRTEIALREYGPTPFPAYDQAVVVGVRAQDIARQLSGLSESERAELIRMLASTTPDGELEPETPGTPDEGAATDEPAAAGGHSGPALTRVQARARLVKLGVLFR